MSFYDGDSYNKNFGSTQNSSENGNNSYSNYTYSYSYKQPEQPKKKKKLNFVVKVIVAGLIFGLVAGGTTYGTFRAGEAIFGSTPVSQIAEEIAEGAMKPSTGSSLQGTAVSTATAINDVSDIAKNVMPAIVQVTNVSVVEYRGFFGQVYSQPTESLGSGIIIGEDENNIYIATNNHVISGSREITITFSDSEAYAGELQGTYPDRDLAVVKVAKSGLSEGTTSEIKIAALADSDSLSVGQATVVIGNALGYGQSVTTGVISALNREVTVKDDTGQYITNSMIQTDATINEGNSGGALLNMNGAVIGIVSAKYSGTAVEGMGYAIPISDARVIIDELIANGSYVDDSDPENLPASEGHGAYLGIYGGMDIDQSTSARYGMPTGVYVSQVVKDSGAAKAGIESGDIIRAVEGKNISSMKGLQNLLATYYPGDKIKVTVASERRNYEDITLEVTLSERPSS